MSENAKKRRRILNLALISFFVFGLLAPRYEHPSASVRGQVLGAFIEKKEIAAPPKKIEQVGSQPAPALTAKSVLVFDVETGTVLYSKNPDTRLPIASLTKLMTGMVAYADPGFSKPITVTPQDELSVSPSLGLHRGDVVNPKDLLKAMIIGSANDSALTLANHFPDKQAFIAKMNAKAQAIGMSATHFSTPIGFDNADNYSTANDLIKLVQASLKALPFDEIWNTTNYSFTGINGRSFRISNTNKLVSQNPSIKSIKTGKTKAAMENMIVMAQGENKHSIVSILVGSKDREGETLKVIDYIFKNYAWNW